MIIRDKIKKDQKWVNEITRSEWASDIVVVHGDTYRPSELPGFVAEIEGKRIGLMTYCLLDTYCEIITLSSITRGIGVGTALLNRFEASAKSKRYTRICVTTTNDNLDALRFYQKQGFRIINVYPNAVEYSRRIKPDIPQIAPNGIPIMDEIELEKIFAPLSGGKSNT
ncbi:MAG: GNAT family N-acetyltransferase [Candidatus Thorarchaeota archaeon]|jgi:ribosomal protein S18 acetylase RimI-like enzyme